MMNCSVKQSAMTPKGVGCFQPPSRRLSTIFLPPRVAAEDLSQKVVTFSKPLYVSAARSFRPSHWSSTRIDEKVQSLITCKANEADISEENDAASPVKSDAAMRVKMGTYFATWWALNVVFNIYNKKVLNAFPFPWFTSMLSLAAGSLIMLISWAFRIAEAPKTDLEFWKKLFPVALAHTIGHVAATILLESRSRICLFVLVPMVEVLGLQFTELNFDMIGFMGAMVSNLAFVFRNIFSKKGMTGKSVSGMNYYACLSILSLLILIPFALAVEGPQMWSLGFEKSVSQTGPNIVWWMVAQSVLYHLYNQVSYMSLRYLLIVQGIGNNDFVYSLLHHHFSAHCSTHTLWTAIAVLGTFLYSQAKK
ncbi:hypothetical protein Leryth_005740 [Lithospermum erythrorhizon]|nr:hypothetical protein Leryth_005740 [Lithospermum erythrorhizon]